MAYLTINGYGVKTIEGIDCQLHAGLGPVEESKIVEAKGPPARADETVPCHGGTAPPATRRCPSNASPPRPDVQVLTSVS
jgi:hypothetical protein